MCEYTDYNQPEYDCATYAILTLDEAMKLAQRLKAPLMNLPVEIAEAMSDWAEIACPLPSDVRDCFKEITECLVDEGCHFRIFRKYSRNGYIII